MTSILQGVAETRAREILERVDPAALADKWGPEKVIHTYDPKTGVRGVLVIDNTARGPGSGGLDIGEDVSAYPLFRLARTMTWKTALAELPFGGARAGIKADPLGSDRLALVRSFAKAIAPYTPAQWISAPGMNVGEKEIEAFVKEVGDLKASTGKPEHLAGVPHETGTGGFAVGIALEALLERAKGQSSLPESLNGTKVVIQGFDSVGLELATFLNSRGAQIVAVCDSWSGICNDRGIDITRVANCANARSERESLGSHKEATTIIPDKIYDVRCDVFVPASNGLTITAETAPRLKSKCVVEAADNVTTFEAEKYLHRKGIFVLPDIVANAGGVIGSYAEFLGRNVDDAFAMIHSRVKKNVTLILDTALKNVTTPRTVAMDIAMERVAEAMGSGRP